MAKKKKKTHKAGPAAETAKAKNSAVNAAKAEQRKRQKELARESARIEAAERDKANRKAKFQQRAVIGGAAAVVVGLLAWSVIRALPEDGSTTAAGWDLPAEANDPSGDDRIQLSEFVGTPVVVNFYADWCTACNAELPAFARVSDDLRDQVQFVGVNTQDDTPFAMPEAHGVDWWPLASDINGTIGGGSGLYEALAQTPGMPITAFFSADGQWLGSTSVLDEQSLRAEIASRFGIQA